MAKSTAKRARLLKWLLVLSSVALLVCGLSIYLLFAADMQTARSTVTNKSRQVNTSQGIVEYADAGQGYPVLSIHGAGGGFDQGLANANSMLGSGFRVISPSRFGYLGTPVPKDASTTAQAEAHLELLNALGIERVLLLGVSAGTRSALELALRHPERVSALILIVPATYVPASTSLTAQRQADFPIVLWLVNAGADFAWWALEHISLDVLVRFIGVPPEVVRSAAPEDRQAVLTMIGSIQPLSARFAGINIDSQPQLTPPPLRQLAVPTLLITARDDLFNTFPAAEYAASQIKDARLVVFEHGGHLLVGHGAEVRARIASFLEERGITPAQSPKSMTSIVPAGIDGVSAHTKQPSHTLALHSAPK
jgi:2-hydroxy-6-oxonona-2,4-dienedioate hydrolase